MTVKDMVFNEMGLEEIEFDEMEFEETCVSYICRNRDSEIALLSIVGMFGDDRMRYYILGGAGEERYLCVWVAKGAWGICTVISCFAEVKESDIATVGELCEYIRVTCY